MEQKLRWHFPYKGELIFHFPFIPNIFLIHIHLVYGRAFFCWCLKNERCHEFDLLTVYIYIYIYIHVDGYKPQKKKKNEMFIERKW